MDISSVLAIFRIVASEFKDVDDSIVNAWIELTQPLVSRRVFKKLHKQALALRTAHRMKLPQVGTDSPDPLEAIGNISVGNFMRVGSYNEGKTAISFNHDISQYKSVDAELALTEYGMQYLTLRRTRVAPIVSAAETRGG